MPKNLKEILEELIKKNTTPFRIVTVGMIDIAQAHKAILALLPEAKEKVGDGSTYLRACGWNEYREDAIKRMKGGR